MSNYAGGKGGARGWAPVCFMSSGLIFYRQRNWTYLYYSYICVCIYSVHISDMYTHTACACADPCTPLQPLHTSTREWSEGGEEDKDGKKQEQKEDKKK